ncbi:hypothetical protein [Olleya namhaensis]|uniref:hypothetical protein n=1 Tax=Olleya namhaensis TaxID=1144750 RepID=UPI00232ADEDD|nr:hypothetical protein [Olleya namhaensis]
MARFSVLVISLLIGLSALFTSEVEVAAVVQNTFPQHTVQASTALNSQGVIVNTQIDLTVNLQAEDSITFFKQLAFVNAVSKEQQENFLVYQKTNTSIDVGLSKTQIIYPFHWFT